MKFGRSTTIVFVILLISFFVRIYRITELTEFLGDQGRESIVLYNAWHTKTLPLVGPPVSTGQHLGPIYYYLIAPSFFLAGLNPFGPIVFMVLLDVTATLLLYLLVSKLFNKNSALCISILYGVSPLIVQASRTIWNPTPIPFFTLLLLISLYQSVAEHKFRWLYGAFATLGVLVQLHYSTIILIPLTGIAFMYMWKRYRKDRTEIIKHTFFGTTIFILLLLPFLIYQSQIGWTDIRSLLSFASSQSTTALKTDMLDAFYITQHLMNFFVPALGPNASVLAALILVTIACVQKNKWALLAASVIVVSIAFISKTVYSPPEHYARFLIPFLFILVASSFDVLTRINAYAPVLMAGLLLAFVYLPKSDVFSEGKHDLSRTEDMVDHMVQSANESFSFTLISSRSFSDLHYRFFFLNKNVQPVSIESDEFNTLYLVCEKDPCPTREEIMLKTEIQAMCFDPLCDRDYPRVSLAKWQLDSTITRERATLYIFNRKSVVRA